MVNEADFIAALRTLPLHPGADGLADDAATLAVGGATLVLTHDMIAQGVHYLPGTDPADIAWKLVAVNLSDLAAKGAQPLGLLIGATLAPDSAEFVEGLRTVLDHWRVPLMGGDTIALSPGAPGVFGCTAIGLAAHCPVPVRTGARAGDLLWVTGSIGDAGAGLAIARGEPGPEALRTRYLRPEPRLDEGRALAPVAHAMMDVSDGLLIDAGRMAAASGVALALDLASVPMSPALRAHAGDGRAARLAAATAGDDYELLFALPADATPPVPATCVGRFSSGAGLSLYDAGTPLPLPDRIGFQHH